MPTADAFTRTDGFRTAFWIAAQSRSVASRRLARIRAFAPLVQRWGVVSPARFHDPPPAPVVQRWAIVSPARFTIPPAPSTHDSQAAPGAHDTTRTFG